MSKGSRAKREHRESAPRGLRVAVITGSDTKDEASDESGRSLRAGGVGAGHRVVHYGIVRDEIPEIRGALETAIRLGVDAVIMDGGTGAAHRDVTVEAGAPLLEKTLDGFGGPFRVLGFRRVGSAAMLSRAGGGGDPGAG